jgi:hypothetical protein
MAVHQAVTAAATMVVELYMLLVCAARSINNLPHTLQGPSASVSGTLMTAQQKQYMAHTFSLLPPHFDRCCLAVCSWAGGLYSLWPLITMSSEVLQSPTCCTPGQPSAYPWFRLAPAECDEHILGTLSRIPLDMVGLLAQIHTWGAPTDAAEGTAGSLAMWLGCLTGPEPQHKGQLKHQAPPPVPPAQALMYRLASLPSAERAHFLSQHPLDSEQLRLDLLALDALLGWVVPLTSLMHLAVDASVGSTEQPEGFSDSSSNSCTELGGGQQQGRPGSGRSSSDSGAGDRQTLPSPLNVIDRLTGPTAFPLKHISCDSDESSRAVAEAPCSRGQEELQQMCDADAARTGSTSSGNTSTGNDSSREQGEPQPAPTPPDVIASVSDTSRSSSSRSSTEQEASQEQEVPTHGIYPGLPGKSDSPASSLGSRRELHPESFNRDTKQDTQQGQKEVQLPSYYDLLAAVENSPSTTLHMYNTTSGQPEAAECLQVKQAFNSTVITTSAIASGFRSHPGICDHRGTPALASMAASL